MTATRRNTKGEKTMKTLTLGLFLLLTLFVFLPFLQSLQMKMNGMMNEKMSKEVLARCKESKKENESMKTTMMKD